MLNEYYSLKSVSEATETPPTTIKSWLHKGVMIGADDIVGGGQRGKRRGFSLNSVVEIATAKAVLDNGRADLGSAFAAANRFAHTGADGRRPALPFVSGGTLMFVSGSQSTIINYVNGVDYDTEVRNALRFPVAFLRIDMVPVLHRVAQSLGGDIRDVVEAAYGVSD